jgi:hypothetical protein
MTIQMIAVIVNYGIAQLHFGTVGRINSFAEPTDNKDIFNANSSNQHVLGKLLPQFIKHDYEI